MDLSLPIRNCTFVAFDTETSGQYPIGSEIVEYGAIRWQDNKEMQSLQLLAKPKRPIPNEVIKIHGITNEMLTNEPSFTSRVPTIQKFQSDCVLVAHHAPFDMGFLSYDWELAGLPLPTNPVLCTSLLSIHWIPETKDHKLQTLVEELHLSGGTAHRALDDARACMQVLIKCLERMPKDSTLGDVLKSQKKDLDWKNFSIQSLRENRFQNLIKAIQNQRPVDLRYLGGSKKGETRRVLPKGIVRTPDGDYLSGHCLTTHTDKRYYLKRIAEAEIVFN